MTPPAEDSGQVETVELHRRPHPIKKMAGKSRVATIRAHSRVPLPEIFMDAHPPFTASNK
jgi:hypothetical protein